MNETKMRMEGDTLVIMPQGKIDTTTAPVVEKEIEEIRASEPHEKCIVDLDDIVYVASSGLRVILKLRKEEPSLRIINASLEVYEVLSMTGFTEMIPTEKALRKISVDGCDIIGQGAKGTVYRYDADTIIKVYKEGVKREDIERERALARKAFVLGVPTAISYDVVRVGNYLGSVFELLDAKSLSELMKEDPAHFDGFTETYVNLLKGFHENEGDETIPDIKPLIFSWLEEAKKVLTEEEYAKIKKLIEEVPDSNTLLHCDYHTNNVMVQNGEALLIDMDTMSKGNPIFELANVFATYVGFGEVKPTIVEKFIGLPFEKAVKIWDEFLPIYLSTDDATRIEEVNNAARLLGYLRVLRHNIRRGALDNEEGKKIIDHALSNLRELLEKVDHLAI